MDGRIVVQRTHTSEKLALRGGFGQMLVSDLDAHLLARLDLHADVHAGIGTIANLHNNKVRLPFRIRLTLLSNGSSNFSFKLLCNNFAINDCCHFGTRRKSTGSK